MAKKRTTAQRRAAAKEAWARRRAAASPAVVEFVAGNEPPRATIAPPVTVSVTKEGHDLYLGISNNGSLHRVKVTTETLRAMALDALRLV